MNSIQRIEAKVDMAALRRLVGASNPLHKYESCIFTCDYGNCYEIYYELIGKYALGDRYSEAETPDVEIRGIELGTCTIPLSDLSNAFIEVCRDHVADHVSDSAYFDQSSF